MRTLPATVATRITTRSRRLTRPLCTVDDGLAGEDASPGADGAATCASAHAAHGSQSVYESGMSRPHDPQCFTRTTPDHSVPRDAPRVRVQAARPVPRTAVKRAATPHAHEA